MNHPTEYYKAYTIEVCSLGGPKFIFYLTEQGIDHDYDMDQDGYRYCGNCKWADSIEEAKLLIDEIVPFYVETTVKLGGFRLRNITKFDWLSDAIKFAGRFNGELSVQFTNP